MIPFVGLGAIHEARSSVGDPGTLESVKFLGADGTASTMHGGSI